MSSGNRVGIIIPTLSDTVHWFDNIKTVKDVLEAVVAQNVFLDRRKVAICLRGRIPRAHELIPPGEIVQVQYELIDNDFPNLSSLKSSLPSVDTNQERGQNTTIGASSIRLADRVSGPKPKPFYKKLQHRHKHSAAAFEMKIAKRPYIPRADSRKILLRFHLLELAERPIELYASNYEPLQLYFNIVRNKLLQLRWIDKEDELDFRWPNLRWVPHGSVKVKSIRTELHQKTISCFVRKKDKTITPSDSADKSETLKELEQSVTVAKDNLALQSVSSDSHAAAENSRLVQSVKAQSDTVAGALHLERQRTVHLQNEAEPPANIAPNTKHEQGRNVREDKHSIISGRSSPMTDCSGNTLSTIDGISTRAAKHPQSEISWDYFGFDCDPPINMDGP
ncbi:hypothetical protein TWF696_001072 [Orbilia brochopaga]|uniref:Uncharacterized protein n=1 Tax=Orbilia brochopaga TaxID=3140254 RepID=A0AAV9VDR9_9PEZI